MKVWWFALLIGIGLCAADVFAQDTVRAARPAAPGAPVVFNDDTLFVMRTPLGAYTPAERAQAIRTRLEYIVREGRLDSVHVRFGEAGADIVSGDVTIMTVTAADAAVQNGDRDQLAAHYRNRIHTALNTYSSAHNLRSIITSAAIALGATVILVFLIGLLNRAFRFGFRRIELWKGTRIRAIQIQKWEVLSADRLAGILRGILRVAKYLTIFLIGYIYLSGVFSLFPWTQGVAKRLFDYILSPVSSAWRSLVDYLPNTFFIAVIVVVTRFLIQFVRSFFDALRRGTIVINGFFPEWSTSTYKIVRFFLLIFALIVMFPYLPGSDSPAFRAVGVFLGILFSLGSTSAVANVVAGVMLTYMRPFKLGDRVKIADTVGDVIEKTLLVTRVRTIKNVDITVPNALVLGNHIINYSAQAASGSLVLHSTVTIGYDAPWRKVHELLIAAALATQYILPEPKPFILQTSLDDFYVSYEINAYTDHASEMATIYAELHQNIQDKFNEAGVEITSPHFTALRDGNRTAIPDDYLPKNYRAPGFRIMGQDRRPQDSE